MEEVISDLKKQLDDIWRLSEEDRRKAIKRLYLKWHPDKNSDNQDFAEKVFKFLNSEIEARNTGRFHRDDLNETARRHRNNFFREHHAHTQYEYSSSSSNARGASDSSFSRGREFGNSGWGTSPQHESDPFGEENVQPQPKPDEGKRWLKQAEANFDSLRTLFDNARNKSQLCGDVCFIAHQVAEKALKGGKYFVCGLDDNALTTHNISTHAHGLQSERPGETHGLVNIGCFCSGWNTSGCSNLPIANDSGFRNYKWTHLLRQHFEQQSDCVLPSGILPWLYHLHIMAEPRFRNRNMFLRRHESDCIQWTTICIPSLHLDTSRPDCCSMPILCTGIEVFQYQRPCSCSCYHNLVVFQLTSPKYHQYFLLFDYQ